MGADLLVPTPVAPLNPTQLKLRGRAALRLIFLACTFGYPTRGQEPKLIVAPVPKRETLEALEDLDPFASLSTNPTFTPEPVFIPAPPPKPRAPRLVRRSPFALDYPAMAFGLLEGASELLDGVTTKYFLHHCSTCIERDPVSRTLLGSRPTWPSMIAAGSVEGFAAMYLNQSMRRSRHKFMRRCAPLVPFLLTGIHLIEGVHNLSLKNNYYCPSPGDVLTSDNHCAMPTPVPAGGVSGPARPGNPARISLPHWK
jgi:hypothetical protein